MEKIQIKLIEVGRDNKNETFYTEESEELGEEIIAHAKQYLGSNNVWLAESKDSTDEVGVFLINAGFHTVGKAEMRKVNIEEKK